MLDVTVFDNVGLIPSFWLLGFERLALRGEIRLRYAHGQDNPISNDVTKWKSVVFTTGLRSNARIGLIDIFDSYASFHPEALEQVDAYFKFNYDADHVRDHVPPQHHPKIHPTGFYFPVSDLARPGGRLTRARAVTAGLFARRAASPIDRLKQVRFLLRQRDELAHRYPTLDDYVSASTPPSGFELDLFWNVSYWHPNFDPDSAKSSQRVEAMRALARVRDTKEHRLRFGFVDKPAARAAHPEFVLTPSPSTKDYVRILSRSKMTLVTRGLAECFSWRVGEQLALGRLLLMERPHNTSLVPLEDGVQAVFFQSDLSDLEEKIRHYLTHDDEREAIAQRGRDYFRRHCLPEVQVRGMLDVLLPRQRSEVDPRIPGARL